MNRNASPRVLFVTKGLDIGGLERVVVDQAVALVGHGVPVEVAIVNDRRDGLIPQLTAAGVPVHALGGTDVIGVGAARRLARLVTNNRFDIVHVHGPLPSVLVRLTPRHRPVITTSHTPLNALRLPTRLAWLATAWSDSATVAVSATVASSMPRRLAAGVVVLPHGLDPRAIARAAAGAPVELGSDGRVTAVAVASHRDAKNYPNLLRAVKVARDLGADLRLVAVGAGPGLERHRALALELGLADVVTFSAPTPDALGVIAASDLLVVASDYEGQPLVVLEALALGIPVVATAVGRVPELVSPALGRVVPPGDPRALGAALAEVAGSSELRQRMGEAARHAGSSWTLEDAIHALLAVYAEVLAK